MQGFKRLSLAVLTIGLLASALPQPAQAEPVLPIPKTVAVEAPVAIPNRIPGPSHAGTCVGYALPYCTQGWYDDEADAAWRWAKKHPYRYQRLPVKFPSTGAKISPNNRYPYVVYVIHVGPREDRHVWKYGITRQQPWTKRARAGELACQRYWKRNCTKDWVAATQYTIKKPGPNHGPYYNALFMERSLFKRYHRVWGQCPRGARTCE